MQIIEKEDNKYPNRLKGKKNRPKVLYTLGNVELLNTNKTVGIVGSRNCTEYGREVAYNFAKELSKKGICIVSGMAVGIDGAAHLGAIQEKGSTIAVIGSGFNYIYPEENEWLFNKIINKNGIVISEYEPNTEVDMSKFPKRNRIIAGLSDVLLVVEAEYRSGSSITANLANDLGKTVCAIPSNITSSEGIGTNRLIQEGAILVTKPGQILGILENKIEEPVKETIEISKDYEEIYNILSGQSIHINQISKKINLSFSQTSSLLTLMELEGLVIQEHTNFFKRK